MFGKKNIFWKKRINKVAEIILFIAAGFFFFHLFPQSEREKNHCAALIRQYTWCELHADHKYIMTLSCDTAYFTAAWINQFTLFPSCHGQLISVFHKTPLKNIGIIPPSTFVLLLKDSLENRLDSLNSEKKELHYYLRIHNVEDEGFGTISAFNNRLDSAISDLKEKVNILNRIKNKPDINIYIKEKYTVIYNGQRNKLHEETCFLKRYSTHNQFQIFQIKNRKTPEHVKTLKSQKYLKDIPEYIYTQEYGLKGQEALLNTSVLTFLHRWNNGWKLTAGQWIRINGYRIQGKWNKDTLYYGIRVDSAGTYTGEMDRRAIAQGWGKYDTFHGDYYEGTWKNNRRNGFGYAIKPHHRIRAGEWKNNRYYGERVNYTSNRIYGIDVSKYQHISGHHTVTIKWKQVRITGLGQLSRKRITGVVNYKISFAYIKSTEGRTHYNRFYRADYRQAKTAGIKVGTYHYFSTTSSATQQAYFFLKRSIFRPGDFPPVLDVEPSYDQIKKIGGADELFSRIRIWLHIVEQKTGTRPILYISQIFVNRYLPAAPDIMHNYQIWIARYGEYKPDVRLAYWQLSPDGKVKGIHGAVDINVFNGYHKEFNDFIRNSCIK